MMIQLVIFSFVFHLTLITFSDGEGWDCVTRQTLYRQFDNILQTVLWSQQESFVNMSKFRCAFSCANNQTHCKAIAVGSNNNCILLGDVSELFTKTWSLSRNSLEVYHLENEHVQFPIYRISKGSAYSIHDTWLTASPSTLDETSLARAFDLNTPLTSYYKHPLLDEWSKWNVIEISMYLYTAGKKVVELQFKTEGSASSISWFSLANVVSSPWADLHTQPVNYFTFTHTITHFRRFYINSNFGGCQIDMGWLMMLDGPDVCVAFTTFPKYPVFTYAIGQYRENWENGAIGSADDLVVFAKVKL